jgi:hypothetical protein
VLPVAYNRLAMLTGYIAPNQRFVTCPNQDVVYATGWFDLTRADRRTKGQVLPS